MNNYVDQLLLFAHKIKKCQDSKYYGRILTIEQNKKGVITIDSVKGCTMGASKYPTGGCYGECYAYAAAVRYGIDFTTSVSRKFLDREHLATIMHILNNFGVTWYRMGVAGDPSHDWNNTLVVCNALRYAGKVAVITTKHWIKLSNYQIDKLKDLAVVFNTSISGLDSDEEIDHRISQARRIAETGIPSIYRIVTCKFGSSKWAKQCREKQDYLLSLWPIIDNPFRVSKSNPHVINGDIEIIYRKNSIGGKYVSLNDESTYLGKCETCPDQCGVDFNSIKKARKFIDIKQMDLFNNERSTLNEHRATATI